MAKREYDPVETTLIKDAASDALEILNDCDAGAVTRFVRSGERLLRLRLSVVPVEDAEVREVYNGKTAEEWYSMQAQQALHLAGAIMLLKRFAQHELPEHEDANEDDVTLVMGHIDHEHYRHSVRLAKEFLTSEVNAVR